MFKSVTVTNYVGDSLELPLEWPNEAGLLISSIDGISPGNVSINSQDYAIIDGGVYNSSRMETRNIVIEFYYGFDPHIETSRHRAYRYFPIKTQVRLDFLTDERDLSIWGYVESNDTQIFSEQEKGQVSIVCVDPYFYDREPVSYVLGDYIPEFEFVYSNESLTEPLTCFGEYGSKQLYDINYQGDIEVGVIIRIRFNVDEPSFEEFTINDVTHSKDLVINISDTKEILLNTVYRIEKNCEIVFDSTRGNKDIYYNMFGKRVSLIGLYDVMNFPWMYLTPGRNLFSIDLPSQYSDEITVTVEHNGAYGGV